MAGYVPVVGCGWPGVSSWAPRKPIKSYKNNTCFARFECIRPGRHRTPPQNDARTPRNGPRTLRDAPEHSRTPQDAPEGPWTLQNAPKRARTPKCASAQARYAVYTAFWRVRFGRPQTAPGRTRTRASQDFPERPAAGRPKTIKNNPEKSRTPQVGPERSRTPGP